MKRYKLKRYISVMLAVAMILLPVMAFPAANLLPNPSPQFFNNAGAPCSGCKLYFYDNNTSTAKNTYISSAMTTTNTNPVTLNTRGEAASGIWLDGADAVTLKTSAGSTIWGPKNDIRGVADVSSLTGDALRWVPLGLAPIYLSATQFIVAGDVTATLPVSIRVKLSITGSTLYGRVTASSYAAAITTVTVALDSGSINSTISEVSYSLESPTNPSLYPSMMYTNGTFSHDGPNYFGGNIQSAGTNTFSGSSIFSGAASFTTGTISFTGTNKISVSNSTLEWTRNGVGPYNITALEAMSTNTGTNLTTLVFTNPTFTSAVDSAGTYILGPTGVSGVTKTLSCMDTIPSGARFAVIGSIARGGTTGQFSELHFLDTTAVNTVGLTVGGPGSYDSNTVIVPLDATLRFRVYWTYTASGVARLFCSGYIM